MSTRRGQEGDGPASNVITSLQNERIKAIRALEMRKVRKETGLFAAEGTSLLVTARDEGWVPETFVSLRGACDQPGSMAHDLAGWARGAGASCLEVVEAVLAKIAAKDNPQSMIGVFRQAWGQTPEPEVVASDATWLALEEVRDPGNLGTIIRTVDAVGAAGIVLVGTCCDPYSRECVRASMGSIFSVPLARLDRGGFLAWAGQWRGDILGLHLEGADDYRSGTWKEPVLAVMGSEGPGLSSALTQACTRRVRIPMAGKLDSLNLAVATALTLYQVRDPYLPRLTD